MYNFTAPKKICGDPLDVCESWINSDKNNYIIYKTLISPNELEEISQFKKEACISVCSDLNNRAIHIEEVIKQHYADFEQLYSFSHFYFLLESSPEYPILMKEMGLITEFADLLNTKYHSSFQYYWAVKSVKDFDKKMCLTIQAAKK